MDKEFLIIKSLFENKDFSRKVSPFVNQKYFDNYIAQIIAQQYTYFVNKYKNAPKYDELVISLTDNPKLSEKQISDAIDQIEKIKTSEIEEFNVDYLVDMSEKHFQEIALEKCIIKAAEILNNEEKRVNKHMLPDMMREALKITFQNNVGQVYGSDKQIEDQYYYYHHKDHQYPLPDWKTFTELTNGGLSKKRILLFVAGTNVGKTSVMTNVAMQLVKSGCNVLYVTAEDGENAIIERVDGNNLDMQTSSLPLLSKKDYMDKLKKLKELSNGRLIIKEYPTAMANANHVRALIDELEIKEDFKPDFLIIDYLNIFGSIRYQNMGDTYVMVKSVTEEFRGLGVEKNMGVVSATQLTRSGFDSSNPTITDVAESFGTMTTADLVVSIIENDNLKDEGKYLFCFLKSRYKQIKPSTCKFLMKVDKDKQKITELPNPRDGLSIEEESNKDDTKVVIYGSGKKFSEIKPNGWKFS